MKTAILATLITTAAAFAPAPQVARPVSSSTSLSMAKSADEGKTFAASALAAAYLLTSVVSADAALAMDNDFSSSFAAGDSSSIMLAGRSGGRAGGRAAPRAAPRPTSAASSSAGTTVINKRTTVIQAAPPVVVGGGGYGYGGGYGGGYGYGYDPTPGLVFGAVNAIGTGMREGRQNAAIAEERAQLEASKERERDMAERLRQLEMMQMQQGKGQPQVVYQQMPPPQYVQPGAPIQVAVPQQ